MDDSDSLQHTVGCTDLSRSWRPENRFSASATSFDESR